MNLPESPGAKYLTFRLAKEYYGIDVNHINQLIAVPAIRHVPGSASFIKGVVNLRGRVLTVMDLRLRLNLPYRLYDNRTGVVVVKTNAGEYVGLIVDEVEDVQEITAESIEPPPEFGLQLDTDFLYGIHRTDEQVVFLLDLENVLSSVEYVNT